MTGHPRRDAVWWAGLVVAAAAAAATAHGLYAVADASGVPWSIAALYPLMTDGLALVAYSATGRLRGGGRRYAWAVVVAAAGLSGVAQAAYLADGVAGASPAVKFGIGAAPAVAAAAVAHLLHMIRTSRPAALTAEEPEPVQPPPYVRPALERETAVQSTPAVSPVTPGPAHDASASLRGRPLPASATARADRAARSHLRSHGSLPTATELVRLTGVSRGTAGTVLKGLRNADPSPTQLPDRARPATNPDTSEPARPDHPAPHPSKIRSDYTPRHHDPEGVRPRAARDHG